VLSGSPHAALPARAIHEGEIAGAAARAEARLAPGRGVGVVDDAHRQAGQL